MEYFKEPAELGIGAQACMWQGKSFRTKVLVASLTLVSRFGAATQQRPGDLSGKQWG